MTSGIVVLLVILFTTTQPKSLPLALLITALAGVVWLVANAGYALFGLVGLSRRKRLALTAASAAVCGLILVLQAAGQLTLRDLLGFLAVFGIAWLYISRFSLKRSP